MRFLFKAMLLSMAISTASSKELDVIELTQDNHINFNMPFTGDFVSKKQLELAEKLPKLSKNEPFYVVLNTPGGSIDAGNDLISFINAYKKNVKTITLFAASMGYMTVQSLGERILLPSATLMSHRASISGLGGQVPGELITRLNLIVTSTNSLLKVAADRVGMSVDSYKKLIHDELWLYGVQAITAGHADRIALVKCSNNLFKGESVSEVQTPFGFSVKVKFSKCPLVTEPLGIEMPNREPANNVHNFLIDYRTKPKTLGEWNEIN